MEKRRFRNLLVALTLLPMYSPALSIEGGAAYVEDGGAATFAIAEAPSIGPISVRRMDLRIPHESLGGHYALTSISFDERFLAAKAFALELPAFDGALETDRMALPFAALEFRIPTPGGRISAGYFATDLPGLPGRVDGLAARLRFVETYGYYVRAVFGDAELFGLGGVSEGRIAISSLEAGRFDGRFYVAGARWNTYGIAGAYARGNFSLSDNLFFNLFSGKEFGAEGSGSLGAFGAWGLTEFSRGKLSFSLFSFLGLVWSDETELAYREEEWILFDADEFAWNGAVAWNPAGIAVFYPNLLYAANPSLSIRVGRLIPFTWGWDLIGGVSDASPRGGSGDGTDGGSGGGTGGGSGGASAPSIETILFSGLSVSLKFSF